MRENTDKKNSEYGNFSRSDYDYYPMRKSRRKSTLLCKQKAYDFYTVMTPIRYSVNMMVMAEILRWEQKRYYLT